MAEIIKDTHYKDRKRKGKCCMCGREMEAPWWENPPFYCYKCADKHEVGNPETNT